MVDQDAIPAHILEMFNKEALKHKPPRQYRTKLINELFTKDAKTGKYEMAAHKPMFENYRMASSTKFGEEKMTGQPKSVFLYSYFHGNEAGLERAISMGDVQCWLKGGTEWCGFQQTSAGTRKEKHLWPKAFRWRSGFEPGAIQSGKQSLQEHGLVF